MVREMQTERDEKPKFPGRGSGRSPRGKPEKASSATALMEAVVERAYFAVLSEEPYFTDGLNLRIRNRTSGGVVREGRRYWRPSYPKTKRFL